MKNFSYWKSLGIATALSTSCLLLVVACGGSGGGSIAQPAPAPAPAPVPTGFGQSGPFAFVQRPLRKVDSHVDYTTVANIFSVVGLYGYSLSDASGPTLARIAPSLEDMCFQLQVSASNNRSAESARQTFFASHCPGMEWDPESAEEEALYSHDSLKCFIAESVTTSPWADGVVVEQVSNRPIIFMQSANARADIVQSSHDGVHRVRIDIFNKANVIVSNVPPQVIDSGNRQGISVGGQLDGGRSVVVTCLPSVRPAVKHVSRTGHHFYSRVN